MGNQGGGMWWVGNTYLKTMAYTACRIPTYDKEFRRTKKIAHPHTALIVGANVAPTFALIWSSNLRR
jgi:hypothetical protein